MFIKFANFFLLLFFYNILLTANGIPTATAKLVKTVCPLDSSCGNVNETSAVCLYDDENGCIRKFKSKCHLDIAACHGGKIYSDYSDLYCSMESYLCEASATYARWTIFHGYE